MLCFDEYDANDARRNNPNEGYSFLRRSLVANSLWKRQLATVSQSECKYITQCSFKKREPFPKQGHWYQAQMGIFSLYLNVVAIHIQQQTLPTNAAVERPLLQHSSYACSLTATKQAEVKCWHLVSQKQGNKRFSTINPLFKKYGNLA